MDLYDDLINRRKKISIIGLGYVGLPLALAFGHLADVIAYDISEKKINKYLACQDPAGEVEEDALASTSTTFTSLAENLALASFHIITVPTPITENRTPNLSPLLDATKTLAQYIKKGDIVVYESTVYPGVTEDLCGPLLEEISGLELGVDFSIGYSPERINPGDTLHHLDNILKVVSGYDATTLDIIAKIYELIITAGVHRTSSIKVAEAAKVIENAQRDINIAFMNELSIIFKYMNLDTLEVLEAANTKWNFLPFYPGLVGGHCIGIDPYYLTHRAEELGYTPEVILSGRNINQSMGLYVGQEAIKLLSKNIKTEKPLHGAILGITFKENCADVRNSRVIDILDYLQQQGMEIDVTDPLASYEDVMEEYQLALTPYSSLGDLDIIIIATPHKIFGDLQLSDLRKLYRTTIDSPLLMDLRGLYSREEAQKQGFIYWRL